MDKFNQQTKVQGFEKSFQTIGTGNVQSFQDGRRPQEPGRTAVWQARLALLVMINIAQLWILSATVEAALAGHYSKLMPLVISSGVCWAISLTIFLWWKPASRRRTSTGYMRGK